MALASRCGPLCQHPGCWHSGTKHRGVYPKSEGYLRFLEGAYSRLSEPSPRDLSVSDGDLPTLKVQTLDDTGVGQPRQSASARLHRRTISLPPLTTPSSRSGSHLCHAPSPTRKHRVHYVQMLLEEDIRESQQEVDREGGETGGGGIAEEEMEIVFSPVLIWKPGKRQRPSKAPPPAPMGVEEEWAESGRAGRVACTRTRLAVGTTDLTDALPPERTGSSQERKATPKEMRRRKRLTSADIQCFPYLDGMPAYVVAEILEHLRSESSSSIGALEVTSRPVTTAPSKSPAQLRPTSRPPTSTSSPPPALTNAPRPPSTCVPSSLIYDLSSKRLHRATSPRQAAPPQHMPQRAAAKKLTSFSRELARQPVEVLKHQQSSIAKVDETDSDARLIKDVNRRERGHKHVAPPLEVRHKSRFVDAGDSASPLPEMRPALTLPHADLPPPDTLHLSCHQHPSHTTNTRYMFGNPVTSRIPQKDSFTSDTATVDHHLNSLADNFTCVSQLPDSYKRSDYTSAEAVLGSHLYPHSISPRMVTFSSGVIAPGRHPGEGDAGSEQQLVGQAGGWRPGRKIAQATHPPKHHLPLLARLYTHRPFSEEGSPFTPDSDTLTQRNTPSATPDQTPLGEDAKVEGSESQSEFELQRRALASPDHMLVGARFSGDQLVLVDGAGQVVHQLTDTESDANILASTRSRSSTSGGTLELGSRAPATPPHTHTEEVVKLPDGVRAPPPTASSGGERAEPGTGTSQHTSVTPETIREHTEDVNKSSLNLDKNPPSIVRGALSPSSVEASVGEPRTLHHETSTPSEGHEYARVYFDGELDEARPPHVEECVAGMRAPPPTAEMATRQSSDNGGPHVAPLHEAIAEHPEDSGSIHAQPCQRQMTVPVNVQAANEASVEATPASISPVVELDLESTVAGDDRSPPPSLQNP